jgi:hypothetical protein
MMVYHWKQLARDKEGSGATKKQGVRDFAAFIKYRVRRSGLRLLLVYLVIAFAFGVAGNMTASFLDRFFSFGATENKPQTHDSRAK